MKRTVEMVYDGEVLRPQEHLDLEPNARYQVAIEDLSRSDESEIKPGVFDALLDLIGDYRLPADFAEQHDHYIHGTPKR